MPLELPLLQSATRVATAAHNSGGTSRPTSVTSGTSNAKNGTYTELLSSTAWQSQGIFVQWLRDAGATIDGLLDIAIGASSSEQVIISNIGWFNVTDLQYGGCYFPIKIPEGVRISANAQQTAASAQNPKVQITLFGGGPLGDGGYTRCTTYGANTGDSGGVSIDPGGTANTKPSSYTEIVSSSTNPIRQLAIFLGNQANSSRATAAWLIDIAVGAASSEQIIIPDLFAWQALNFNQFYPPFLGPFPCHIPAGTRISARAQCDITDATDRLFDIILYGLD